MTDQQPAPQFPPRPKMFTHSGNLSIAARVTLNHIRAKQPTMQPESPPLTSEEREWLLVFVDEWARRMERGLLSRKLRAKYRRGKDNGKEPWRGQK